MGAEFVVDFVVCVEFYSRNLFSACPLIPEQCDGFFPRVPLAGIAVGGMIGQGYSPDSFLALFRGNPPGFALTDCD